MRFVGVPVLEFGEVVWRFFKVRRGPLCGRVFRLIAGRQLVGGVGDRVNWMEGWSSIARKVWVRNQAELTQIKFDRRLRKCKSHGSLCCKSA